MPRRSSRYPEVKLADLDYADDIALFEESDAEMANTTEAIRAITGKLGLKMSYKKTEIMSIGKASGSNPIFPVGNEGLIKVVDHFKYLGAFCSAGGTNVKELNSRIGKTSAAFRELDKVWRDRNINLDTNVKFYNACVLSILLYACECWTLTERDEARLDAFDINATYNGLVIYNEWTWTVSQTNCTSRNQPMANEYPADRRLLGERSSRKTSVKWTCVGL